MSTLGVEPGRFTPGGLRGGGAVALYLKNKTIADVQWVMRLASQETLRYYLQETAALNSMMELSCDSRERIRICSAMYEPVIQTITDPEAAPRAAPGSISATPQS